MEETRRVFGLECKVGDVIAQADFRVYGKGWNDALVDDTVHATLEVSGATQYGNGTCMAFEWSNGNVDSYDTRYEQVTPDTFGNFALDVLRNYVMKSLLVYQIHCKGELEQDRAAEKAYTGKYHVGDIIQYRGHECRVTRCWMVDEDDGNGISIIPTGGYGFGRDILESEM